MVLTGNHALKARRTGCSVVTERALEGQCVTLLVQTRVPGCPKGEVKFTALKPENWKVEFARETAELGNREPQAGG